MKRVLWMISMLLVTVILLSSCSTQRIKEQQPYSYMTGCDDLGRPLVSPADSIVPEYDDKKQVGIFYFLWLGTSGLGLYDNTKIMASTVDAQYKPELWGGFGVMHFWGEPLFDYYVSTDEWVVRRHVQMLTDADVDFLVFDTTNNMLYGKQALLVMKVLLEYQKQGMDVPKVAFYTNTDTGTRMNEVYELYTSNDEYESVWYKLGGKPMIIGRPEDDAISDETSEFFTVMHSQWPNEKNQDGSMIYNKNGFPWMEFERPQHVYNTDYGKVINVSVAQHAGTVEFGDTAFYGDDSNWTRSYHNGENDKTENAYIYGYNLSEQFNYAIAQDPDIVFITGWNEWIAGNWGNSEDKDKPLRFVDCADANNSRDIEPMKGGYGDSYYMLMVNYIRLFKGIRQSGVHGVNSNESIYTDYKNDTIERDKLSYGYKVLTNSTGRNDIDQVKVNCDGENIYFTVQAANDISPIDSYHCMNIYISSPHVYDKGSYNWYGYDYVINRVQNKAGKVLLESCKGGYVWEKSDDLVYTLSGNTLSMTLPLKSIGVSDDYFNISFKVADNYQGDGDIWSFYIDGDCAPYGRLNYLYNYSK